MPQVSLTARQAVRSAELVLDDLVCSSVTLIEKLAGVSIGLYYVKRTQFSLPGLCGSYILDKRGNISI